MSKIDKPLGIKMIEMIEVQYERSGDGLPIRTVRQYWDGHGQLVGELDPYEDIKSLASLVDTSEEIS